MGGIGIKYKIELSKGFQNRKIANTVFITSSDLKKGYHKKYENYRR
jgi:hypothetical protein